MLTPSEDGYLIANISTIELVINLNREDGGQRKFILVEMADYFDTVLLPRIKKVTFTPEWKDGKPKRMATAEEAGRSPRIVKVVRLESYEDALNNITFDEESGQQALQFEDYLLRYMLKWETNKSETLLDVQKLAWQLGVVIPGVFEILPIMFLETLTMLALSFLGSVLFSSLANGITVFLLYGVALLGGMVEQVGALARGLSENTVTALINAGIITSLILPVDALYRRSIYLASSKTGAVPNILHNLGPFGSLSVPSVWMEVYAVVYLGVCLAAATFLFSRKDI